VDVMDFLKKWGVTRAELAMLIEVSTGTIDQWLAPNTDRYPSASIKRSLLYLDALFSMWLKSEGSFAEARAIFDAASDRGDGLAFKTVA